MAIDKGLLTGGTTMLILKLLEESDMYGYQMIEELSKRSDNTFELKAGTLYPILHSLEQQGMLEAYDKQTGSSKVRKYYKLTDEGIGLLRKKSVEWESYSKAVNKVLKGDAVYAGL